MLAQTARGFSGVSGQSAAFTEIACNSQDTQIYLFAQRFNRKFSFFGGSIGVLVRRAPAFGHIVRGKIDLISLPHSGPAWSWSHGRKLDRDKLDKVGRGQTPTAPAPTAPKGSWKRSWKGTGTNWRSRSWKGTGTNWGSSWTGTGTKLEGDRHELRRARILLQTPASVISRGETGGTRARNREFPRAASTEVRRGQASTEVRRGQASTGQDGDRHQLDGDRHQLGS